MNATELPVPTPTAPVDRGTTATDIRLAATMVAIGISFAITVGGIVVNEYGYIPGAIGLPVVAVLAWQMGPELVAADGVRATAIAFWFGAKTILITAAWIVTVLSGLMAVAGLGWTVEGHPAIQIPLYIVGGAGAVVGMAIILYLAGLAVVGLPMLALVLPAGVVWAILVRAIGGRQRTRGGSTGLTKMGPILR
jgi:hypothetical protein